MNYTNDKDLYIKVFSEIAMLHDDVGYRKRTNAYRATTGAKARQYPAVTVGAKYGDSREFGNQHSPAARQLLHLKILDGFAVRLGSDVNGYTGLCGNAVGHCAENYAASKVLDDRDSQALLSPKLEDIAFTYAFNPRIWKKVEWCENCHKMFDSDGNNE